MADLDREVLIGNEAFVLGMVQAVAGGAVVASLAQAEVLKKMAGDLSLLLMITGCLLALFFALLAAYWKHQYKMWDVKSGASVAIGQEAEAAKRQTRSSRYLRLMRRAMAASVIVFSCSIAQLVFGLWAHFLC